MGACDYEAVSALVDGELNEDECDAVIQHLNQCRQCCHLFERFHATRGLVRGEGHAAVPTDLSERIATAIAAEEASTPAAPRSGKVVAGPGAGREPQADKRRTGWAWVASAAGVAGIAVVAGSLWLQNGAGPGSAGSPSLASSTDQPVQEAAPRQTPASPSASDSKNSVAAIQRYLPEHSSFVPSGPGAEFQRTHLEVKDR